MRRKAEVMTFEGEYAVVRIAQTDKCVGCNNKTCRQTCAHVAGIDNNLSVTAIAKNTVGASVGDTVEIESSAEKGLIYTLIAFILPIIVCVSLYAAISSFFQSERVAMLVSFLGFVSAFLVVSILEKKHANIEPDFIITKVIETKINEIN